MAKETLPTNYTDDIMASSMAGKRRYNLIQNSDGTVSLEDVTNYTQVGSNFGAAQMNQTNTAVNNSADKNKIIDSLADVSANTQGGMMAGALAVRELNSKLNIDYIVEEGGNAINGYRKWKSGRMEQWKNAPKTIPINTKWGGVYISQQQSGFSYNEQFASPPSVIMDVKGETKDGCWIMKCNSGDATKTPDFFLVRGDAISSSPRMSITVYAIGYWK